LFTIEMDWDETAITILDRTGEQEDLEVIMYDDVCYIRQWDEDIQRHHLIVVSPEMMLALHRAFNLPQGAYLLKTGERK
jgi:hypothetical protein